MTGTRGQTDEAEGSQVSVSDPSAELRVLVIGYGLIGRQRAEALADLPAARLAATVDPVAPDPSSTRAPSHYNDFAEVSPELYDAAIIAVPHDRAVELATAVLRAGRPVLIEKPLGVTADQARRLEELAEGMACRSFVGYNYRFLPAVRTILEVACSGQLGRLRNLDLLLGHGGHAKSEESWKLDPIRAGGGVLLDPGVHLLDLPWPWRPASSARMYKRRMASGGRASMRMSWRRSVRSSCWRQCGYPIFAGSIHFESR